MNQSRMAVHFVQLFFAAFFLATAVDASAGSSSDIPNFLIVAPKTLYRSELLKFQITLIEGSRANPSSKKPTKLNVDVVSTSFSKEFRISDYIPTGFSLGQSADSLSLPSTATSVTLNFTFTSSDLEGLGWFAETITFISYDRYFFIQTDKPVYQPGERVHITAVGIDHKLMPLSDPTNLVVMKIIDPVRTVLFGKDIITLSKGVEHLTDDQGLLIPGIDAITSLGRWTIRIVPVNDPPTVLAETNFYVASVTPQNFDVQFKVNVNGNNYIIYNHTSESNYRVGVTARKWSGEIAHGKVVVTILSTGGCNYYQYDAPVAAEISQPKVTASAVLPADGSPADIKLAGLNDILHHNDMDEEKCVLTLLATFTEDLSGLTTEARTEVPIYRRNYFITLDDSVKNVGIYQGAHVDVSLRVLLPDGRTVGAGEHVVVAVHFWRPSKQPPFPLTCLKRYADTADYYKTLTTNEFGAITIGLEVPSDAFQYRVRARLVGTDDVIYCDINDVRKPKQASAGSIWLNVNAPIRKSNPKIGDHLTFHVGTTLKTTNAYLLVFGSGGVFQYKRLKRKNLSSKFNVKVELTDAAPPQSSAIAWVVDATTKNILATGITFKVDGYIRNTVKVVNVSSVEFGPGDLGREVTVQSSGGQSNFVTFGIDKTAYDIADNNGFYITPDQVLQAIAKAKDPVNAFSSWQTPWSYQVINNVNAQTVFKLLNLMTVSDGILGDFVPIVVQAATVDAKPVPVLAMPNSLRRQIVRNLPAALFVEEKASSSTGKAKSSFHVPYVTTSIQVGSISVSQSTGIGFLRPPQQVDVVIDVDVVVEVPVDAVALGEEIHIKVIVANRRSKQVTVTVRLLQSDYFKVSTDDGVKFRAGDIDMYKSVAANSTATVRDLWLRPTKIGTGVAIQLDYMVVSDGVTVGIVKKIDIFAPGEWRYLSDTKIVPLPLVTNVTCRSKLPQDTRDVVRGSLRYEVTVLGEAIGPLEAMTDGGLSIPLPKDCGEQNMFSPTLEAYGAAVNGAKYKPASVEIVRNILISGVEKQILRYRRTDLSFSLFGNSDKEGSVWLTALSVRALALISDIPALFTLNTVNANDIEQAWRFIVNNAQFDGTFTDDGHIVGNDMRGSNRKIVTAAYVFGTWFYRPSLPKWKSFDATLALLKQTVLDPENKDPFLLSACLRSLTVGHVDFLTKVEFRKVLARLKVLAIETEDAAYWLAPNPDVVGVNSPVAMVETAGAVMLSMLNANTTFLTQVDLFYLVKIANFLSTHRNPWGAFYSTHDTLIALEAFAILTISAANPPSAQVSLKMSYADSTIETCQFNLTTENFRTPQLFIPKSNAVTAEFTLATTEKDLRYAHIQLATFYNVWRMASDYYFLDFNVKERSCINDTTTLVTCVTPDIKIETMTIIEVGFPTGFDADLEETIEANTNAKGEKRVKSLKQIVRGARKLVYYLDDLLEHACVFTVVKQVSKNQIRKVQPAQARIYAYYEPSEMTSVPFIFDAMNFEGQDPQRSTH